MILAGGARVVLAALGAAFLLPPAGAQKPQASEAAGDEAGDALPADFRGRISYSGTHQGQVTRPGPAPRRLNLRDLARAAGTTREYAGAFDLELEFNGNAVSGRYSGTGGMSNGTMSGTRHGTQCRLIDDRYGTITEATCTRTRFIATARNPEGSRERIETRLEAEATQFVDGAEEERQRRSAAAGAEADRQRLAAERQRQAEAEAARLRAAPRATPAQVALLERAVRGDLPNWGNYAFDAGSLRDVRVIDRSGTTVQLRGDYSFNGGTGGWVRGEVSGGRVTCLEYSDAVGCNPPRPAPAAVARQGQPRGGTTELGERFRTNVSNFVNVPSCVIVLDAEFSTERRRRENAAYFWYEEQTLQSRPSTIRNRCDTARLIEVRRPQDVQRVRVGRYQELPYRAEWTYRDLGVAQ